MQRVRALSLLVGLGEVDSDANYYRRHMAGFDGRNGCRGCVRDVEMMDSLTHYLGYERVTPYPLINRRATRAAVLGALHEAVDILNHRETADRSILFLYFSCHGRFFGEPTTTDPVSVSGLYGRATNLLLLNDGALLNLEILLQLVCLDPSKHHRVFSVFDCCHAGMGTETGAGGDVVRLASSSLQECAGKLAISSIGAAISGLFGSFEKSPRTVDSGIEALLNGVVRHDGIHFGASWDLLTARGGVEGSLFTRLLTKLVIESGHAINYRGAFCALSRLLPARHSPGLETYPRLQESVTDLCRDGVCFAPVPSSPDMTFQTPFQI